MKMTNRNGFPDALAKAMANDSYDRGDSDYTVTQLLKPARLSVLEERHGHEIEEDVEDGLYRLYGQLVHSLIERANATDLVEKRFYAEIAGKKVSAQVDNLSLIGSVLSDYKFTTSWGFKADKGPKPEHVAQLNVQLLLLRRNGLNAEKLQIVGLLRDWQKREAKSDPNYPQAPVVVMDIPIWSEEQTVSFIEMRIAEHVAARVVLPECSPEERWAKPDQWAVIKRGQKRAINGGVQFSEELAKKVCEKNPGTHVVHRPGESIRCSSYCPVSKFCTSYQRMINSTKADDESETA